VEPVPWTEAGSAPYNNIVGQDPLLTDPANGDFQPLPGSPAEDYGCRTFARGRDLASRLPDDWQATNASQAGNASQARNAHQARRISPATRTSIDVSGPIVADAFWDCDTVRVSGDVTIENGVTLQVSAGVRVMFLGHYALEVQGRLLALGSPQDFITWTSASPGEFAIDSTTAGSWAGIRFDGTSAVNDSSLLEYCMLEYCKAAGDGSRGAALSVTGFSKLRASDCVFRNNVADYGAVLYCANFAAPVVSSSVLTGNHAFVSGSAFYGLDAYPTLANNTIVFNPVQNAAAFDPAACVHNHLSKSRVVNNILLWNASQYFLGGQILEGKFPYVRFNDIEGGHPGEGNFEADPLFVDQGEHPFQLMDFSPCVNAGAPDTRGLGLPALDLLGVARIRAGRIDVGAYESAPVAEIPDAEGPGVSTDESTDGLTAGAPLGDLRAFPNPTRGETTFAIELREAKEVQLAISDVTGRIVRTLPRVRLAAGRHLFSWDGRDDCGRAVSPGIYWARAGDENGARCSSVKLVRWR